MHTDRRYILVVGGAGYIGSHMVRRLRASNFIPIILDNLSTGHLDAVLNEKCIIGDMADTELLNQLFSEFTFFAVMHFASFIQVGESVKNPAKYYFNNLCGTYNVLQAMLKWNVKKFIFSSTAAVYGDPKYTPIDEMHPIAPINPYGRSKRMIEEIVADFGRAYDLQFSILRYFNAAGADPSGRGYERHQPETHLIPLILQAAEGREPITIFGSDYPTLDGTCIRDYIHVSDVCDAHILALEALTDSKKNSIYNLGTGYGYSVRQVIDIAQAVTKKNIPLVDGVHREGDPAILVANPEKAMLELGWQPRYTDLAIIIKHAWEGLRAHK